MAIRSARRRRARRGSLAALLRRIPRHRHRRCDDPRAAVHAPVRARRRGGRDLECRAGRALPGRAQSRAVPAVHRAARASTWTWCGCEAPKDFRLEKLSGQPVWYVPADEDAEVALDMAWQRLTGTLSGEPHGDRRQGPRHPRAGGREGRRALFVPPAVRAAARRQRLSAHRARIPHAHPRSASR